MSTKQTIVSLLICLLTSASLARGEERPSILVLLGDNWAWPHASVYGASGGLSTPNFDRLAREGVLLTHAFCHVPSCSAARATLLTGQAAHRLGSGANLWGDFPPNVTTYTSRLAEAGYFVGHMIKGWGPGKHPTLDNPAGKKYDDFATFLAAVPPDRPFCFWFGPHDPHQPWNRGTTHRKNLRTEAVRVPPYLPNVPVVRETIVEYFAEVQQFDHDCGRLLDLLKAEGRNHNTIVVMLGDNGWQMPRGLANVYDMGTRVPMAIRWPAQLRPQQTVDALVSFEDLAPTFLAAAGEMVPESMTGRNLIPLLAGQPIDWRQTIFLERERHANVRQGDRSYPCRAARTHHHLLIRNLAPNLWPAGDPDVHFAVGPFGDVDNTPVKELILSQRDTPSIKPFFDQAFGRRPAIELYDLDRDPYQLINRAEDLEYRDIAAELDAQLAKWMRETDDPRAFNVTDQRFDRYPYYGRRAK